MRTPPAKPILISDVRLEDRPVDLRIEDGRIAAIGHGGEVDGTAATRVEGGGGHLLPGFVDAHVHLVLAGTVREQVDLSRCRDRADFERRLKRRAATLPADGPDAWLIGHGWLESDWGGDAPDRSWLARCGDRPVVCVKHDHHAILVNDVVLEMLGEIESPPGGEVVRDADGRPTGLMLEAAAD